jgi:hypothetical protein
MYYLSQCLVDQRTFPAVQRMIVDVRVFTKTLRKCKDLELLRNFSCQKFNEISNLKKIMYNSFLTDDLVVYIFLRLR